MNANSLNQSSNLPLNLPALEAAEALTGFVPEDVRNQILSAPLSDNISGLREIALRLEIPDGWDGIKKPKQEIGAYVESVGFKVPKRYATFDEAMHAVRSGKTVHMRSEHPKEYDGFSGLLRTHRLSEDRIHDRYRPHEPQTFARLYRGMDLEGVEHEAKWDDIGWRPMKRYLELSGQDVSRFYDDMSYSFWEHIPGKNIMVAADDSIEERYHITAIGSTGAGGGIYDPNGSKQAGGHEGVTADFDMLNPQERQDLIKTYERIRNLQRFCSRICPIMEMQLGEDGQIWFLQYHKSRPFRQPPERLDAADYPEADGWRKVESVRGALGSLVTLRTALWYPDREAQDMPKDSEEASFDFHYDVGFSEFIARRRIAYLSPKSAQRFYMGMADGGHELRSRWFKTHGAIALGQRQYEDVLPEEKRERLSQLVHVEGKMARFVLDVASDGRDGYVRLNPESQGEPEISYM